jgi:hypothetical protein
MFELSIAAFGVLVLVLLGRFARPAYADLKCGDAPPVPFGHEGLVIAWTGPVPRAARVSVVGPEAFQRVSDTMGSSFPESLPEKYRSNRQVSEVFNASIAWDMDDVRRWTDHHGMKLCEKAQGLFGEYLNTGAYVIFQSLVEHPAVADPELYAHSCSVVAQRGDIYWSDGVENIFLRSYFHNTAKDIGAYANFGPAGGLHISFATDTVWYPLRVTKLNEEPTSVELNIFTKEPLTDRDLPESFTVRSRGHSRSGMARYSAVQATATFGGGVEVPDVHIHLK